jgi:hypothetical protein
LFADDGQLCPTQRLGDWFGHRGEQVTHETLDESAREQLLPVRQCLTQLSQTRARTSFLKPFALAKAEWLTW